jgi:hypothetical protein
VRLKVDENLGRRWTKLLHDAGYDVSTVPDQGLTSASDATVIAAARDEDRCLVTLDLDFANPLRFPPADYRGIAVLRLPAKPTPQDLDTVVLTLAAHLEQADVTGRLWIVEAERVREYQPPAEGDGN